MPLALFLLNNGRQTLKVSNSTRDFAGDGNKDGFVIGRQISQTPTGEKQLTGKAVSTSPPAYLEGQLRSVFLCFRSLSVLKNPNILSCSTKSRNFLLCKMATAMYLRHLVPERRRLQKTRRRSGNVTDRNLLSVKVSASLRRSLSASRKTCHRMIAHLEGSLLHSAQGQSGLVYHIPTIPSNVKVAQLVSAFNATVDSLSDRSSNQIETSSRVKRHSSVPSKDLLDSEFESFPPPPKPPEAASTSNLLLPELFQPSLTKDFLRTSRTGHSKSIDELLCDGILSELQPPLIPVTRTQVPKYRQSLPELTTFPLDPSKFPKLLSFDGQSSYPLLPSARASISQKGITSTWSRGRELLKKRAEADLRDINTNVKAAKIPRHKVPTTATPSSQSGKDVSTTTGTANPIRSWTDTSSNSDSGTSTSSYPKCLAPGSAIQRKPVPNPSSPPILQVNVCDPSKNVSSAYTAYNPARAPFLPSLPPATGSNLMEEINSELESVLAMFEAPHTEEDMRNDAPPPKTQALIAPLTKSFRWKENRLVTCKSTSFKDRLRAASQSALLAAANEVGASDMRWFHARSWRRL